MKNKILFTAITFLTLALGVFTSCEKVKEFESVSVTAVPKLYEPVEDRYAVIEDVSNLYFEWGKAQAEDNSVVYYDILFDKLDGDFSNPIYIYQADGNGLNTGATITKKGLNRIARLAGAKSEEEATVKWTVRSNRGMNFALAQESRTITLLRMAGLEDLDDGERLYIGGAGSEQGQRVKMIETKESTVYYEIYTKLEASEPIYFYTRLQANSDRIISIKEDGKSIEETAGSEALPYTVDKAGVYRIKLDFKSKKISFEEINRVAIRNSWTNARGILSYTEKGVWELMNYNVQLQKTDWGFDERYKIEFTVDGKQEDWGQIEEKFFDNRPSIDRAGYRDMAPTNNGQWEGKQFKFPEELCDRNNLSKYFTDITISMTAEKNYTHDFTNINTGD
ncbi:MULTISPECIES: SusE domain-containing protein [Bacteroides]|uniref:SusE domain-containing protein n=1 Tax=Bacteroides TaxID=816 RepID=UPI0014035DD1|nr:MULTISPECIES: SusE domain-containing protein [Bacteroides]